MDHAVRETTSAQSANRRGEISDLQAEANHGAYIPKLGTCILLPDVAQWSSTYIRAHHRSRSALPAVAGLGGRSHARVLLSCGNAHLGLYR